MGLNQIDPSRESVADLSEDTFFGSIKTTIGIGVVSLVLICGLDKCSSSYDSSQSENYFLRNAQERRYHSPSEGRETLPTREELYGF